MGQIHQPDTELITLETRCQDGVGFRVDFGWREDRYGHQIATVHDPDKPILFVAELGGGRADWPDSPPLQQISWMETTPGRRIALLVGMAGKSHWSVSIETDPSEVGLLFDVACRVHRFPEWLGTTYRCSCPVRLESPHVAQFTAGGVDGRITTELTDGTQRAAIEINEACLSIKPALDGVCAPHTVRWKYRIAMTRQTKQHEH